jgi:hypothetical protein
VTTAELPPGLADVPLDRIEDLERETGRGFGAMVDELASGKWSISTMRALVALVDPEREVETMGDLMAAAGDLMGKGSGVTRS